MQRLFQNAVGVPVNWGCAVNLPLRVAKQSVNDLAAFDLSKRSAEEIALQLVCWKQQHKQQQGRTSKPRHAVPKFMPVIIPRPADGGIVVHAPVEPGVLRYSAPFIALLAAGADRADAAQPRTPALAPAQSGTPPRPGHRSKRRWALAGAVSLLAVTAVAGPALWQGAAPWRVGPVEAPVNVTASVALPAINPPLPQPPTNVPDIADAAPAIQASTIAAPPSAMDVQTASLSVSTTLSPPQQAIDAAPLHPAASVLKIAHPHLPPILKPRLAVIQTAAKPVTVRKPRPFIASKPAFAVPVATAVQAPSIQPEAPAAAVAAPVEAAPAPETKEVETERARPEVLYQHGNDKAFGGIGARGPAGGAGSGSGGAGASGGTGGSGGDGSGGGETGGGTGSGGDGSAGAGTGGGGTGGASGGGDGGAGGGSGGDGSGGSGSGGAGDGSGGSDAGSGDGGTGGSGDAGSGDSSGGGNSDGGGADSGASGGGKAKGPKGDVDIGIGGGLGGTAP